MYFLCSHNHSVERLLENYPCLPSGIGRCSRNNHFVQSSQTWQPIRQHFTKCYPSASRWGLWHKAAGAFAQGTVTAQEQGSERNHCWRWICSPALISQLPAPTAALHVDFLCLHLCCAPHSCRAAHSHSRSTHACGPGSCCAALHNAALGLGLFAQGIAFLKPSWSQHHRQHPSEG